MTARTQRVEEWKDGVLVNAYDIEIEDPDPEPTPGITIEQRDALVAEVANASSVTEMKAAMLSLLDALGES